VKVAVKVCVPALNTVVVVTTFLASSVYTKVPGTGVSDVKSVAIAFS